MVEWGTDLSQRQTKDLALSKVQQGSQGSRTQERKLNTPEPLQLPPAKAIMDLLHSWGVELALHLQTRHSGYQDLFSLASALADLHTTFFFFFPIWFHLRRDTALRLVWVAVLGDWLNLVLKWYEGTGGWGGGGKQREARGLC